MEIRTLKSDERPALKSLLDAWKLAEGWTAGDRFHRQTQFDPRYSDDNVWVAIEDGNLSSALTIFPRHLRILGHSVPSAGIGNVVTEGSDRGRLVEAELVRRACDAMLERGIELAVSFPSA